MVALRRDNFGRTEKNRKTKGQGHKMTDLVKDLSWKSENDIS